MSTYYVTRIWNNYYHQCIYVCMYVSYHHLTSKPINLVRLSIVNYKFEITQLEMYRVLCKY